MFIANLKIINEVIYLGALNFLKSLSSNKEQGVVVYGGDQVQKREKAAVVPWNTLDILFAGLEGKQVSAVI
jgi:hypothetical protein